MEWTTTFLGDTEEVEAETSYAARKKAIEVFKEKHPDRQLGATYLLINHCRVRRHEDKRIRY